MLSKVRSGSLQSPYDPDAQYRKKNKQECWGYSGQIVEDRDGEKGVSLISFFDMKGFPSSRYGLCEGVHRNMGSP
ncbi:hypothetical protein [Pasteuria penetrans]|uniref:hypothetical protein n=1 Tax=Pasteuria penetrans TaxID=86005 RepID=UPI0011EF35C2|nr:hypothetical protein [Pasteuria penetrans]